MPSALSARFWLGAAATVSAFAVVVSLVVTSDDPNGTLGTIGGCGMVAALLGHLYRLRVGEYERGRQAGYDDGVKDGRRQPLGPVVVPIRMARSVVVADGRATRAAARNLGELIDGLTDRESERRPG